jgi:hypothetical protein
MWGSGEIFLKIGIEVNKQRGSSGGDDFLPLEQKLSYILKLMTPRKKPILDQFA